MKKHTPILFLSVIVIATLVSCKKKEKFTIEDRPVTGTLTYVTQSIVPQEFDTATQQMISAMITMQGSGNITDMGDLTMLSSFTYNFVTGTGSGFVTTYSGTDPGDTFSSTGSSQRQQDGSILTTETFSNGTGRFSKIKGGGETIVNLTPDGSGGTGTANWTVTY